jgi:hypothetical protein
MTSEREQMEAWSNGQLFDFLSNSAPDSSRESLAMAEIMRRQTYFQQMAAEAQRDAAEFQNTAAQAAIDTAEATRRSANYVLLSVIVLAVSSILGLVVSVFRH